MAEEHLGLLHPVVEGHLDGVGGDLPAGHLLVAICWPSAIGLTAASGVRRRLARAVVVAAGRVTIKFGSELPSFNENLNQVMVVSLLVTYSTALANEGAF